MTDKYPTKIQKVEENKLIIFWNDDKVTEVSFQNLRDECPCVNCKGESVIFDSYIPIKAPFKPAGFYEIEKIEPVGNYAIQIHWRDGHNTGLYNWELLLSLSEK
jgi:DUF971 family protein